MTLYAWPARTVFGRAIPKSRIYSAAQLPRAMQAKFVDQPADGHGLFQRGAAVQPPES